MPQASEELRSRWGGYAGVGEDKAIEYLQGRGYILSPDWFWFKPHDLLSTERDFEAMQFLIDEWDFGGLRTNSK